MAAPRSTRIGRAAAIAIVAVGVHASLLPGAHPAPARAGALLRYFDFEGGTLQCLAYPYCMDGSCAGGEECMYPDFGPVCIAPSRDLFCCASAICPVLDGAEATCELVVNDVSGAALSVCRYAFMELCDGGDGVSASELRRCYTSAVDPAAYVHDWASGDCDGDAVANGVDADPCSLGSADGGAVAPDAALPDAGVAPRDGGSDAAPPVAGPRARGAGGCGCTVPGASQRLRGNVRERFAALTQLQRSTKSSNPTKPGAVSAR